MPRDTFEEEEPYTNRDRMALVPGEPALDKEPIITPEMLKEPIRPHKHAWTDNRCACGARR